MPKTGWGPWPVVSEIQARLYCDSKLRGEYLTCRAELFSKLRAKLDHSIEAKSFLRVYLKILRRSFN